MNRSSPRTEIVGKIYTSTDHPSDQAINMHNELSYSHEWPGKIMFCCLRPSETGGETPIADSRKVWAALSTATRAQFAEKGVMYVRRLGGGLGLTWQEVFQTSQRSAVEEECHRHDMDLTWQPNDRLLLRWKRPAIKQHPVTGEWVWFNHALFFSAASLDEIIASTLGHDNIPFNTCYGDGSPIPAPVIAEINQAFKTAIVKFKWQKGDVLYLDNHLMAHGREPFTGERKIAVIMWDKHS
jgi:alpha-ketoglutarate-dependent taurine dioxygenase